MTKVQIVGHRGWPARFPDNTLAGFLAVSPFVDGVEMDVRRSADGKLVLAHDPELGGLVVAETPWPVLAEIDLGDENHPALLDEVLAALPATPAQIEIKNLPHQPGFEPDHRLALEAAARSRPGDTVISLNHLTVAAVRRSFDHVKTGLAVFGGLDFREAADVCQREGHTVLVADERIISTEVSHLGLEVFAWTVNDIARAHELVDLAVAGIITDDAPRLAAAIAG